ncbi:uncharacterized protein PG998_011857 [Apiospora kogelbergensis]|uniref:uncharacterized protein n=1 Tax=Apiospora kogelbergensis TaxID=1337665 RepID=UPI0031312D8F
MVELRGGLIDGLGHSPLLQRALSWADFAYATMAAVPLSFPLVPQIAGSLDIQDRFTSRSMMINHGATAGGPHRRHGRHNLLLLNRESAELFELLFSSTEAVNNFEFARLDELRDQRNKMSDTIYLLEYRLCTLEQQARARAERLGGANVAAVLANPTDLSESLIYASHLFLHLALRGQPPTAKRHKALTEALMTSLSGILVHMGWLFDAPSDAPSPPSYTTDAPGAQSYDHNAAGGCWPSSSPPNPGAIAFDISDMRVPVKLETETEPNPAAAAADDLHDDVLLWIMFVGCCVQMRPQYARNEFDIPTLDSTFLARDHRTFFVLALRRLCRERAISGKEALIDRLRSIVWMNTWCERQLDMVWALLGLELEL